MNNWFMPVLGTSASTVQARAVARCFVPGDGDPAILALDEDDPEAIRFNGGGSSGVNVLGDIVSYGGINANGNPSHFNITGSVYAYNGPAPDVTVSVGSYGNDTGLSLIEAVDPVVQGQNAIPPRIRWPNPGNSMLVPRWPSDHGCATISGGGGGGGGKKAPTPTPGPTPTPAPSTTTKCSPAAISIKNGDTATFSPGVYQGSVNLGGGTSTFQSGIYIFRGGLDFGAQARATGNGVLFRIEGSGVQVDVQGGAEFNFTAMSGNTWKNIVFYLPDGSTDFGGNGTRVINGTVYAPNGEVSIHGNGKDAVVNGQVIARKVTFSGNGPAVNYNPASPGGTFGPILVNTPNSGG